MNILKSLLSGGTATLFKENAFSGIERAAAGNFRSFVHIYDTARQRRKGESESEMEFMYCIPDLEVFIDKTIKKCLLEYDLDANDTEAVLDDMEKAWPKTPPRNSDKQVLKDCNDNTDKGWSQKQNPTSNHASSDANVTLDKAAASVEDVLLEKMKAGDLSSTKEKFCPRIEDLKNNGATQERKVSEAVGGGESDRSGCSSPDIIEGKFTTKKHAKLKSRLQQRYFEANHESDNTNTAERRHEPGVSSQPSSLGQQNGQTVLSTSHQQGPQQVSSAYRPSNLDILASAVNLHTESVRREEEIRLQAFRGFQESDSGHLVHDGFIRHRSIEATKDLSAPREMPTLVSHLSSTNLPYNTVANSDLVSYIPNHHQNVSVGQTRPDGHFITGRSAEKSQLVLLENQVDQNGHHVMIPREAAGFRREIPMQARRHSRDTSVAHNPMTVEDLGVAAKHRNSHFPQSFYPNNIPPSAQATETPREVMHPYQKHSSRIASIIAEELQRDEDCQHKPAIVRNVSLVERINPDEGKASAVKELKMFHNGISGLQRLANTDEHGAEMHSVQTDHQRGNLSQLQSTFGMTGSPQVLHSYPNHIKTDPPGVSPVSAENYSLNRYPNGVSQVIRNYNPGGLGLNYSPEINNQPQDLSIKPRKDEAVTHGNRYSSLPVRSHSPVGSNSPAGERLMKGYFSSPNSPLHPTSALGHGEAQLHRKSASPTISSFKELNVYPHKNSLRVPEKWDKRGQVHGMENIKNTLVMDSRVVADRRMAETIQRWSEARQTEVNKKRDNALH